MELYLERNIKTYIFRSCIYNDKLNKTENCKKNNKKGW